MQTLNSLLVKGNRNDRSRCLKITRTAGPHKRKHLAENAQTQRQALVSHPLAENIFVLTAFGWQDLSDKGSLSFKTQRSSHFQSHERRIRWTRFKGGVFAGTLFINPTVWVSQVFSHLKALWWWAQKDTSRLGEASRLARQSLSPLI